MTHFNTVLHQMLQFVPCCEFEKLVNKYHGSCLVRFVNPEDGLVHVLLTNIMHPSARQIADISNEHWQVEMFFKWIYTSWTFIVAWASCPCLSTGWKPVPRNEKVRAHIPRLYQIKE